jgi:hypothetical protein
MVVASRHLFERKELQEAAYLALLSWRLAYFLSRKSRDKSAGGNALPRRQKTAGMTFTVATGQLRADGAHAR